MAELYFQIPKCRSGRVKTLVNALPVLGHVVDSVEMRWHTVTHVRGSEGETGEWSGYPIPFTLPQNTVYPALLPLMCTHRLPVVD